MPLGHIKVSIRLIFVYVNSTVKQHFLRVTANIGLLIMQTAMDGGFSEVEKATTEVQEICDKVTSAFVSIISLANPLCLISTLHKHLLLDS